MPDSKEKLLIFISYYREDQPKVQHLCKRLRQDGFDPWLDEYILPGQVRNYEIEKVLQECHAILLCLSSHSIQEEGYIQREHKQAMKYQEEKPPGAIFVIPVRLDDCELPAFTKELKPVDYPDQYEQLVMALNQLNGKDSLSQFSENFFQVQTKHLQENNFSFSSHFAVDLKRVEIIVEGEFPEITPSGQQDIVNEIAELFRVESSQIRVLTVYQSSLNHI